MPKATLERVVEEARSLTEQEQQQLRKTQDAWLAEPPAKSEPADDLEAREQLFLQELLEKVIISRIPKRDAQDDNYQRHPPSSCRASLCRRPSSGKGADGDILSGKQCLGKRFVQEQVGYKLQ